ncbi:MAG TPA: hypothetical protein VM324_16175 [Egibacteraceae bacterium]|nr:hypothetical protein [Egibacteraceae bacterium]
MTRIDSPHPLTGRPHPDARRGEVRCPSGAPGFTARDAARLLDISVEKLRLQLRDGTIEGEEMPPGRRPRWYVPVDEDGLLPGEARTPRNPEKTRPSAAGPDRPVQSQTDLETEVARLRGEVEQLKAVARDLNAVVQLQAEALAQFLAPSTLND